MATSVLPSTIEMARKRSALRQVHPTGGKVDLTDAIRADLKRRRQENDWSQREMGSRIGITGGAVSGIENGTTSQIHKTVLAKYYRAFGESTKVPQNVAHDPEIITRINEQLLQLPQDDARIVLDLVERLANRL